MGCNKKDAEFNRKERYVTFKIMEELHFLTGLSYSKLVAHLQAAQERIVITQNDSIYHLNLRSRSALYRETKKTNLESVRELKGDVEKGHGRLRVRIIEMPIFYGKNEDFAYKVSSKKIEKFEILRFLCCYEVTTGYFGYKRVYKEDWPPKRSFVMNYVAYVQTALKIPFDRVIFTQRLLNDRQHYWHFERQGFGEFPFTFGTFIKVEQLDFPSDTDEFSLSGKKAKKKFTSTIEKIEKAYRRSVRVEKTRQRKKCSKAYEYFLNTNDVFQNLIKQKEIQYSLNVSAKNATEADMEIYSQFGPIVMYEGGDEIMTFNSIENRNPKFKRLKELTIDRFKTKQDMKWREFVERFGVVKNSDNEPIEGEYTK